MDTTMMKNEVMESLNSLVDRYEKAYESFKTSLNEISDDYQIKSVWALLIDSEIERLREFSSRDKGKLDQISNVVAKNNCRN